jgi:hypothetical protein
MRQSFNTLSVIVDQEMKARRAVHPRRCKGTPGDDVGLSFLHCDRGHELKAGRLRRATSPRLSVFPGFRVRR